MPHVALRRRATALGLMAGLLLSANLQSEEPVHDHAIDQQLQDFAAKVMGEGSHTPMESLAQQLQRKPYPLDLRSPYRRHRALPDAAARVQPAVVCLGAVYKCDRCDDWHVDTAAGFFIDPAGILVTCYHVVKSKTHATLILRTADGRTARVLEGLAGDPETDVAVLRAEGDDYPSLRLRAEAPTGTPVGVWSHPDQHYYFLSDGILTRRFLQHRKKGPDFEMISISADYARGSSGGPVFDLAGNVLGMVVSTHSVYYEHVNGRDENLQMVFKDCASSRSILDLVIPQR